MQNDKDNTSELTSYDSELKLQYEKISAFGGHAGDETDESYILLNSAQKRFTDSADGAALFSALKWTAEMAELSAKLISTAAEYKPPLEFNMTSFHKRSSHYWWREF